MAWRRLYLTLLLVRLYFAVSPSYIHPDEHFQGPQVVAGELFGWNVSKTWEFTSKDPIRSIFPLWPVYALPMEVLRWITLSEPNTHTIFYALRIMFFIYSFVCEDWALQELLPANTSERHSGILLTASSYVTWSYQSHTFSNSVETLLVLWALVLIKRIMASKESRLWHCTLLGLNVVMGFFNRITFPAFLLLPGIPFLGFLPKNILCFITLLASTAFFTCLAIFMDTSVYTGEFPTSLRFNPIITPLNNLRYNFDTSNLARHGLHPLYTHFVANLPQLIGPAFISLLTSVSSFTSPMFLSAVSGIGVLSLFRHQEARFLVPAVPLLLCSIKLPRGRTAWRVWVGVWIAFNSIYGLLMGMFHQGGIVPAQLHLAESAADLGLDTAVWWKTYHPPTWILGTLNNGKNAVKTVDLMGCKATKLVETLQPLAGCAYNSSLSALNTTARRNYLIAPMSAIAIDRYIMSTDDKGNIAAPSESQNIKEDFHLVQVWSYSRHLHLDDLDFGDDGVLPTLQRVIGRRGLGIWEIVRNDCERTSTKIAEMAKGAKKEFVERIKEL